MIASSQGPRIPKALALPTKYTVAPCGLASGFCRKDSNMKHWILRLCAIAFVFTLPGALFAQCETCDQGVVVDGGCLGGGCETGGCESGDGSFCGTQPPAYPVPFATPRPTVPTNLTYPPLYPHHSLPHYKGTYSYRHNGGLSRTNVNWHPSWTAPLARLHHIFYIPR